MLITSIDNPSIKEIQRLFVRKYRARTRLFPVEGLRLIERAVAAQAEFVSLIVAPELRTDTTARLVDSVLSRGGVPVLEVTPEVLSSVSPHHDGHGIAAVLRQRWHRLEDIAARAESCFVAAKHIQQPWSIGTIVRIADAVAADGVMLLGDSTDPHHPQAVRASLGTVFSQRLIAATPRELAEWKEREGCHVVGASPAGAVEYWELDYRGPLVVCVGSEREGLTPKDEAICDTLVRIPMLGRCESHHVTVAAGVILYEVLRQREAGLKRPVEGGCSGLGNHGQ